MIHDTDTAAAPVTIIGAGIAGSEAAWQLASRGVPVELMEMRPDVMGPAHHTGLFAELVCSNSLKGQDPSTAAGMLKAELAALGSMVLRSAHETRVSAGGALAVDREAFAALVTETVQSHPLIHVVRAEATHLPPGDVIVAAGPLVTDRLAACLLDLVGSRRLAFYDAAAPIVAAESIDREHVFAASRWGKGSPDYLNCPLTKDQYDALVNALTGAARVHAKAFERQELFAACQPVEEVARTGHDALRYGALKPVGLTDPQTGRRPWAVVQLRPETRDATAYNLVGFQTNLTFPEQRRVFSLIPALTSAEYLRYGVMHRNTFIDAPSVLTPGLAVRTEPRIRVAGQLSGTEGYLEAAASGLLAALDVWTSRNAQAPVVLPPSTALGALVAYATDPDTTGYQPMHVNFGLMPPLEPPVRRKRERYAAYADRGDRDLTAYLTSRPDLDRIRAVDAPLPGGPGATSL
jgi:methylenetetrahydrofolate--tRNA-(uracil-5-)-methyltransferase